MADKNTPAFPTLNWETNGEGCVAHYQADGMTLRDYFAAKAMQAHLAHVKVGSTTADLARSSYQVADAMLEARNA